MRNVSSRISSNIASSILLTTVLSYCAVVFMVQAGAAQDAQPLPPNNWLTDCYKTSGGSTLADVECQVQYIEKLNSEQQAMLKRIKRLLTRHGPPGTDYRAALNALEVSQQAWQAYMNSDCKLVNSTFGQGTALGLAGATCRIQHLEQRNSVLSQHESRLLFQ